MQLTRRAEPGSPWENVRKRRSKCVNSRTEADDRTRWDRSDQGGQ
jgi:hypothetical protein